MSLSRVTASVPGDWARAAVPVAATQSSTASAGPTPRARASTHGMLGVRCRRRPSFISVPPSTVARLLYAGAGDAIGAPGAAPPPAAGFPFAEACAYAFRGRGSMERGVFDRRGRHDGASPQAAAALLLASGAASLLAAFAARAQHATAYDVADGERAYEAACANCHGPDGDLIPGIDFGRGVYRRELTDAEIARIIVDGIPNTPMPPNPGMSELEALQIAAYLRAMAAEKRDIARRGDPARGRALFEGKGGCLDCHRVGTRGSRSGPDLTRIGRLRRGVELEQSLLDPEAEVRPENRSYAVTAADGERVTGRLLNHDTFTVQLVDTYGRLRSFEKSELLEHGFVPTPMPPAREALDDAEIADVVSYLVSLRGESMQ